jgi:hypothetical protein
MAMTGLVAYDTDVPVLHRLLCSALVYVSMNETAAAAGLSVAAAVSVLSDVLGVSGATISEVSLLQLSNLLAFTLSPSTLIVAHYRMERSRVQLEVRAGRWT